MLPGLQEAISAGQNRLLDILGNKIFLWWKESDLSFFRNTSSDDLQPKTSFIKNIYLGAVLTTMEHPN